MSCYTSLYNWLVCWSIGLDCFLTSSKLLQSLFEIGLRPPCPLASGLFWCESEHDCIVHICLHKPNPWRKCTRFWNKHSKTRFGINGLKMPLITMQHHSWIQEDWQVMGKPIANIFPDVFSCLAPAVFIPLQKRGNRSTWYITCQWCTDSSLFIFDQVSHCEQRVCLF